MRHAVVPSEGFLILAADYSQLELRILAHLSGDERLTKILNDGKDVFKAIAAKWKRIEVDQVGEHFTCSSLQSYPIPIHSHRFRTRRGSRRSRSATA